MGYSLEFLVEVCCQDLQILTLFQTKKCHFSNLFSGLFSKIHTPLRPHLETCEVDFWQVLDYRLSKSPLFFCLVSYAILKDFSYLFDAKFTGRNSTGDVMTTDQ